MYQPPATYEWYVLSNVFKNFIVICLAYMSVVDLNYILLLLSY